jgi:hypothetical protein
MKLLIQNRHRVKFPYVLREGLWGSLSRSGLLTFYVGRTTCEKSGLHAGSMKVNTQTEE